MTDLVFDDVETGVLNNGEPVAVVTEPAPTPKPVAPDPEPEAPEPEASETDEGEEEHEAPRKKTGSQREREKRLKAEAEREYWKAEALKKSQAPEPQKPAATGKPKQDDYDTHEEWVEAVTDWKVEAKLAERENKAEAARRQQTWNEKAEQARAKFEDFDDVLEGAPAPTMIVAEVLNESPIGAEVAYHLATHPEDYKRINAMRPAAAALELGRIEARLTGATQKPEASKPPPTTKAPKPPSPVTAHAAVKPSDDGRLESY